MMSCAFITVTGIAGDLCAPCGFTDGGLPIGLQIVGRPRADFSVLQLALRLPGSDALLSA